MADSDSSDSEIPTVNQNAIIKTTVERRPSRATNRRSSRIMSLAPNRRLVPVIDTNEIPPEISASVPNMAEITRRYSTALPENFLAILQQRDESLLQVPESAEQNSNSLENPEKSEPAEQSSNSLENPQKSEPAEQSSNSLENPQKSEPAEQSSNSLENPQKSEPAEQSSNSLENPQKSEPAEQSSNSLEDPPKTESAEQSSNSLEDPPKPEPSDVPNFAPSAIEDSPKPPGPGDNSAKKKKKAMFAEPEEEKGDSKTGVPRRDTAYPKGAKLSVSESNSNSVVKEANSVGAETRKTSISASNSGSKLKASVKPNPPAPKKTSLKSSKDDKKSSISDKNPKDNSKP